MATYFGEVVERSSRAFWGEEFDSEDDTESNSHKKCRKLEISSSAGNLTSPMIRLFLVAHGPLTEGFVESCFLDKGLPIAKITETENETGEEESITRRKRKPSAVYRLSSDVLLCMCSPHLDIAQSYDFAEKISLWMKNAEQVIILSCSYISGYHFTRYQNDSPDTFLKALKTDNFNWPVLSEILEQPNIVQGVPAAVLTWCQTFKIPAVLYVCYTRSYEIDSDSVKLFFQLFSQMPFTLLKEKPNFTNRLYSGPEISSTLYM